MKLIKTLTLSLIILFNWSCEKDEEALEHGDIIGYVTLFDEKGDRLLDKSHTTVRIENSDHKTISNVNGRYEFRNIPPGSYTLIFEKEGFGTVKKFNFQFVGDSKPVVLDETFIYEQSRLNVKNYNVSYENSYTTIISGNFQNPGNLYRIALYTSFSPDVSLYNYSESWHYSYNGSISNSFIISYSNHFMKLPPGVKYYGILYLCPYNGVTGTYHDPIQNRMINSAYKKATDVFEIALEPINW